MAGQQAKLFASMPRITFCSCSSPWKGHIRLVFWVVWNNWNKPVIRIYQETNLSLASCHCEQVWVVKWRMECQVCGKDFAVILGSHLSRLLLFISSCLIHRLMCVPAIKFCEISAVGGSTFSFLAPKFYLLLRGNDTPTCSLPLLEESPSCNFEFFRNLKNFDFCGLPSLLPTLENVYLSWLEILFTQSLKMTSSFYSSYFS